jgi:DNA polymerase epsilon subunit 1
VSDNGVPDLGGINNEEAFFADEVQQTSLVFPGAYRKVSVELKVIKKKLPNHQCFFGCCSN